MRDIVRKFIFGTLTVEDVIREQIDPIYSILLLVKRNGEADANNDLLLNTRQIGIATKSTAHVSYILTRLHRDGYITFKRIAADDYLNPPRIPLPTSKLRRLYEDMKTNQA